MNKNCFKQIPQSTEVTIGNRGIVYYQSAFDKVTSASEVKHPISNRQQI